MSDPAVTEEFGFDISKSDFPSQGLATWCQERFPDLKNVFKAEFRRYEDGRMTVTWHSYMEIDGSRRMIIVRDGDGAEHRGVALSDPVMTLLDEFPQKEIR